MSKAQRDNYGVPALLGNGEAESIPIKATEGGSLCVTDSKKLLQVIRLDLAEARENVLIVEQAYNEITVNLLDAPVGLNFVDATDTEKTVSIVRPMSITVAADKLWLSNTAAEGKLEVWIWG